MKFTAFSLTVACVAFTSCAWPLSAAAQTDAIGQTITPAFQYAIANVPGKTMSAPLVN